MKCRYYDLVPCFGTGKQKNGHCYVAGSKKFCSRHEVQEERRLMFLDKIKTVSISSKATPTRGKK